MGHATNKGSNRYIPAIKRKYDCTIFIGPINFCVNRLKTPQRFRMRMTKVIVITYRYYSILRVKNSQKISCRGIFRTMMSYFQHRNRCKPFFKYFLLPLSLKITCYKKALFFIKCKVLFMQNPYMIKLYSLYFIKSHIYL